MKKLNVAIIGCGDFARNFVPLFQMHPAVEQVRVCDLQEERVREYCEKVGVEAISSFEEAIADDTVNAIAVFTQRHTHGDLAVKALEAGKDVYSAVPMAITVEDCKNRACSFSVCGYHRFDFYGYIYFQVEHIEKISHCRQRRSFVQ